MIDPDGTLRFLVVVDGQVVAEAVVSDTWDEAIVKASSEHHRAVAMAELAKGNQVVLEALNLDGTPLYPAIRLDPSDLVWLPPA